MKMSLCFRDPVTCQSAGGGGGFQASSCGPCTYAPQLGTAKAGPGPHISPKGIKALSLHLNGATPTQKVVRCWASKNQIKVKTNIATVSDLRAPTLEKGLGSGGSTAQLSLRPWVHRSNSMHLALPHSTPVLFPFRAKSPADVSSLIHADCSIQFSLWFQRCIATWVLPSMPSSHFVT